MSLENQDSVSEKPTVKYYHKERRNEKMKKICMYLLMTMLLCLTACKGAKDKELSEPSENMADTNENQQEESQETEALTPAEPESQSQAEEAFELTDQGKAFLEQMCRTLNDFDSQMEKDKAFYRDFLFYSYTGVPEGMETEQIYREDLQIEETVVKVPEQEAEAYVKLVFGTELPEEAKPALEEMEEGQTACYYEDGFYYIGVSDFPDVQYTFTDYEESDNTITVRYSIQYEDESDAGIVSFTLEPAENENGFIITSKAAEFTN